jgi:hypothetical protein
MRGRSNLLATETARVILMDRLLNRLVCLLCKCDVFEQEGEFFEGPAGGFRELLR